MCESTTPHACERTPQGELCTRCAAFRYRGGENRGISYGYTTNSAGPWHLPGSAEHDAALGDIEADIRADRYPMPLSLLRLYPGRFDALLDEPSLTPVEKAQLRAGGAS